MPQNTKTVPFRREEGRGERAPFTFLPNLNPALIHPAPHYPNSGRSMYKLNPTHLGNGSLDSRQIALKFADPIDNRTSVSINVASPQEPAANYVRIRPLETNDAEPLFTATVESICQLSRWMTWATPNYSLEECRLFVNNSIKAFELDQGYTFAIIDARDNSVLGSIALNHLNRTHKFANVGYWVRTTRTRSGIGSAAVGALRPFSESILGLRRMEFLIPTSNIPSHRVAQRAGAKFEGILRNRLVLAGQSHDAAVYSLVSEDLA